MKKLPIDNLLNKLQYKKYLSLLYSNIRLAVLVLFALLAGYLVLRIDTLLNKDYVTQQVKDETAATTAIKKPDAEVLSLFNELNSQPVSLDSSFSDNRVNPF
jgi:hypothetical protein